MTDKARLRWRCRRGMKELDELLLGFLETRFEMLDRGDRARFAALLECPDPELWAYLSGRDMPDDPALADVVRIIRHDTDHHA